MLRPSGGHPEGSVAISGETPPYERLVCPAAGADVLVHECPFTDQERGRAAKVGRPPPWPITASQLGAVAKDAPVKTLVLTHLSPHRGPESPEAMRRDIARSFDGEVVVGEDLQEVCVTLHGF